MNINCNSYLFADDTTLLITGKSENELYENILSISNDISCFITHIKLYLNCDKTKIMFFNNNSINLPVKIFDSNITPVNEYKILGIKFDKHMKFKNQLVSLNHKLNYYIPTFYSISNKQNEQSKLLLYKSLINSHFTYCSFIFNLSNKTYVHILEKCMLKIIKIPNLKSNRIRSKSFKK